MRAMGTNSMKFLVLHLIAVLLAAGCLFNADFHSERALYLVPAGALMVVVVSTLKDLYLELQQNIRRRG